MNINGLLSVLRLKKKVSCSFENVSLAALNCLKRTNPFNSDLLKINNIYKKNLSSKQD